MNPLIIANTQIRRDVSGRYCLNDLHQASGASKRHQPANWMRLDSARDLISEVEKRSKSEEGLLRSEEAPFQPVCTVNDGFTNGTYVSKPLVYAYAMWISPKFHLHVIEAYDALVSARGPRPTSAKQWDRLLRAQAIGAKLIACMQGAKSDSERTAIHAQLQHMHDDLGIPCPPLDGFLSPDPHRETREAFWRVVAAIEKRGNPLNHSRKAVHVAYNLRQMKEAAARHALELPDVRLLRKALLTDPRLVTRKAVNSAIRGGRTVKCWVFAARAPAAPTKAAPPDVIRAGSRSASACADPCGR